MTGIPYLTKSWNVVVGCSPSSAGCQNCWSGKLHNMRHAAHKDGKRVPAQYAKPFREIQLMPDRMEEPLHWHKPQVVGVCFGADLFHPDVPDEFICRVFGIIDLCPDHEFIVLTKRPERMAEMLPGCFDAVVEAIHGMGLAPKRRSRPQSVWTLPNVWLGASICNQDDADRNIPHLLRCPGRRWLSIDPLLEGLAFQEDWLCHDPKCFHPAIDRVIVGGESGRHDRPCEIGWIRDILGQCDRADAGIRAYCKQLSRANGAHFSDPSSWPSDLQTRALPADPAEVWM